MKTQLMLLLAASSLAMLTACGTPGAPQPPSLQLARPVQDLTVARKGDRVTLTWTPPSQTTDGQNIRARYAGPTYVCRSIGGQATLTCQSSVGTVAASVPAPPAQGQKGSAAPPKAEFTDTLATSLQQQYPLGFAEYAVEATNHLRRSAGLSNHVRVPLAPTLVPPGQLRTRITPDAIEVSFPCPANQSIRGLEYAVQLYRRDSAGNVAHAGLQALPAVHCTISDTNFEWEKIYTYWVAGLTTVSWQGQNVARVEGNDSTRVDVFTHDTFPPAVPSVLEAVASGVGQKPFIDLTWTPNLDLDLDGYNVYRQEQGTSNWVKLNSSPAKTPSFRDEAVQQGKTYAYAVSAIDARRNESGRSAVASETIP